MSVLVKGWSIPTNGCCDCHFRTGKYCGILGKNERVLEYAERYTRPDNCPLEEAKYGKWLEGDDETVSGKCSVCGWESNYYENDVVGMPYCPNCGACMLERKNEAH